MEAGYANTIRSDQEQQGLQVDFRLAAFFTTARFFLAFLPVFISSWGFGFMRTKAPISRFVSSISAKISSPLWPSNWIILDNPVRGSDNQQWSMPPCPVLFIGIIPLLSSI